MWILVLSPPRERPIAWSSPAFLRAGAMLMGAHDGAVDHRVFVVGICGEMLEYPLPHTSFGPTAEPQMDLGPITEPRRQIAPWHPSAIAIQHRLDEQSIVCCGHPNRTFTPWQQVLDPFPLVVAHSEPPHRSAPRKLTAYESKKPPRRNQSRITRCRLSAGCGYRDSPVDLHAQPSACRQLRTRPSA